MLEINVKYRNKMKLSYYYIEFLLVLQLLSFICIQTWKAKISVYDKHIDFLINGPIISLKNARNQCKVQKYNETKLFFHWITSSFKEIECHLNLCLKSLKQCLL